MSKRPNLSALADAAGSVRVQRAPAVQQDHDRPASAEPSARGAAQAIPPSRAGAKPITAFYPAEVRTQLKILAAENDRSMESMIAEALNDLFAKYGKAEIAPAGDRARALSA